MKNQNTLYDIRLTNEEREFLIAAGGNRARKILSRATKINPTLLENKEILTEKKTNELFGKNKYVLYYNFDANKWNTEHFMGYARADIEKDTSEIKKMKTILEKRLSFINTEIVAVVIASDMKYPGWGNTTNIKAEPKNTAVGALICRNKKTGKILPQIKRYIGIGRYLHDYDIPLYAVQSFARNAIDSVHTSKFARTLNELYKLQR